MQDEVKDYKLLYAYYTMYICVLQFIHMWTRCPFTFNNCFGLEILYLLGYVICAREFLNIKYLRLVMCTSDAGI